ncbi:MAG: HNH endonuclease [Thermoanaerobacteraceae bacterium]|nr:HNH endonuclease [Thermoanaerobacteraceae bacterium]
MKALFPESYNFLCDPVSGELRKRKIPDDKTEYLYIFSTAKPYHYRITKVAAPDQKQVIAKNPKWHRDELILALDLYFKIDLNKSSPEHPNVIELSELLNKLPIHSNRPNQEKFCNPNGVHMKLMNFRAIDPNYPGKGLQRGGKLETEIWDEFATDRKLLSRVAQQIRNTVAGEIAQSVANSSEDEEELEFPEGKILYRIHKARERNQTLVRKAKEIALRQNNGRLKCEVCGFDFREAYGEIGEGYIECHHIIPVSELDLGAKTKLTDLALVCSNCHRMLHRKRPWITIEQLKHLYKNNR